MYRNNINYINVAEEPDELYDYARKHGFLDEDAPEEMPGDFDALRWFEGDPDIIKLDGQRGWFDFSPVRTDREQMCFVYFDCYGEDWERIVDLLDKFYNNECVKTKGQTWADFHNLKTGIAHRGGIGYTYTIWTHKPVDVFTVQIFNEKTLEDETPIPLMTIFRTLDEAVDAARDALLEIESEDLIEATVFAGEKLDGFGNISGEPDAVWTISNLDRLTTAKLRREYGYTNLNVNEYLIND